MPITGGAASKNRVEQTVGIVIPKELQTKLLWYALRGHLDNTSRSKSCNSDLQKTSLRYQGGNSM